MKKIVLFAILVYSIFAFMTVAPAMAAPSQCDDTFYDPFWTPAQSDNAQLYWVDLNTNWPSEVNPDNFKGAVSDAARNWTQQHNTCGMADTVDLTIIRDGECGSGNCDGHRNINNDGECVAHSPANKSVIWFGPVSGGFAGYACIWIINGVYEADMRLNTNYTWDASSASCTGQKALVENVVTHEFGHWIGLGDLGTAHEWLTMHNMDHSWCSLEKTTLGRGDILGARYLFP